MGGHDIPHKDIVRRYKRSLENLPQYCRMADEFYLFDASTTPVCLIVARTDAEETVHDPEALFFSPTDHCSPITSPFPWFMAVSRARQLLAVVESG